MKKFLSILLALAVGFTFTFGSAMSAFADDTAKATTDEQKQVELGYLNEAYTMAKSDVAKYGDVAVKNVTVATDKTVANFEVEAANWQTALTEAKNAAADTIAAGNQAISTDSASLSIAKYVDALITATYGAAPALDAATDTYSVGVVSNNAAKAYAAQLATLSTELIANANSIDTSIYSEKDYENEVVKPAGYPYTVDEKAYYVAKTAAVAEIELIAKNLGKKYTVAADATASAVLEKVVDINTYFSSKINKIGTEAPYTYTLVTSYYTKAKETADASTSESKELAAKANLKAAVDAYKANAQYLGFNAATKSYADQYIDAYVEAHTYLIEAGIEDNTTTYSITSITVNGTAVTEATVAPADANAKLVAAKATAAKAKEDAEDAIAETNKDGNKKYDEKLVNANLKNVLIGIYSLADSYTYSKNNLVAEGNLYTIGSTPVKSVDASIEYATAAKKTELKAKLAATINDAADVQTIAFSVDTNGAITYDATAVHYYDLEWAKVTAAIADYNAAIDAASSEEDMTNAAIALNKALAKIDSANRVLNKYKTNGTLNKTFVAEHNKLVNYRAYLDSKHGSADRLVFDITDLSDEYTTSSNISVEDTSLALFYINKNARTADEITALYADATAVLDAAKTDSALKAEADAIVAQIAALPAKANITIADKATVQAAHDAYEALNDGYKKYVTNYNTLKKAVDQVKTVEMKAITTAVKALPTVAAVTVADKAAVKAVADAIDAYNNTEMYHLSEKYTDATVTALTEKIRTIELEALRVAVKALPEPAKVTANDKTAIEAARTAYDAYVTDYADYIAVNGSAVLSGYETTIIAAEKALAAAIDADKWTADDAKAYVQDLAIAVRTVKSGKKVKVTVNADVQTLLDNGFTVEYKFYKSTKKSSGYKNTVNKTTNTYTNTNPVKGKNYYKVKLVVKNADGTVVATTPLTQCKYGVRTMK